MKKKLTGILTFFLPNFILAPILRLLGHRIGKNVKIGFSFLFIGKITLNDSVEIGHLNLFLNDEIFCSNQSKIGYFNILKGPFILKLSKNAAIGNKNYFTRANMGVTYGESVLELGELTKITTAHHIDLTRSITFGNFSILAGINSQMWTHGYVHENQGSGRFRVDGSINIGDNVYIGSRCIINPALTVSNAISIGAGSVVAKNLTEKGMYVNQQLRFIEQDFETTKAKLKKVEVDNLVEEVYFKNK